ncbi:hypothetical protein OAO01_02300 [Oligoflexia bacterium]|nr:hypothetical protein [Oligoflexia bacterium]
MKSIKTSALLCLMIITFAVMIFAGCGGSNSSGSTLIQGTLTRGVSQATKQLILRNGVADIEVCAGGACGITDGDGNFDFIIDFPEGGDLLFTTNGGGCDGALVVNVPGMNEFGVTNEFNTANCNVTCQCLACVSGNENCPECNDLNGSCTVQGDGECSDNIDNDGDGQIDFPLDGGCKDILDDSELGPDCNDGIDNDGDGRIDFGDDPGCESLFDDSEVEMEFECSDGTDNDLDGLIDFPEDTGCSSANDNSELTPQCDDGLDNDFDSFIDFPEDPGCVSQIDNDETDSVPSTPTPIPTAAGPTPTQVPTCSDADKVCSNGLGPVCVTDCLCNDGFFIGNCSSTCFDTGVAPTQCEQSGMGCLDGLETTCPL